MVDRAKGPLWPVSYISVAAGSTQNKRPSSWCHSLASGIQIRSTTKSRRLLVTYRFHRAGILQFWCPDTSAADLGLSIWGMPCPFLSPCIWGMEKGEGAVEESKWMEMEALNFFKQFTAWGNHFKHPHGWANPNKKGSSPNIKSSLPNRSMSFCSFDEHP